MDSSNIDRSRSTPESIEQNLEEYRSQLGLSVLLKSAPSQFTENVYMFFIVLEKMLYDYFSV